MLLKHKNLNSVSIAVVLIFSLSFFQSTPLQTIFFKLQGVFLFLVLLFLAFNIASFSIKKDRFNRAVLYWVVIAAILPFYSAFRSHLEFGQPYMYGILVQRNWLLIGVGVWFYHVITTKQISLSTVEVVFIFMSWSSLLVFFLITKTYNPESVIGGVKLGQMTELRGVRFKFQNFFITFGAIYYFINYHINKRLGLFISMLLFVSYIALIRQGRTYMLALAATFLIYYVWNFSNKKLIISFINVSYFIIISIVFISIVNPDYLIRMKFLFEEMFVVLTGNISDDNSANSRIFQSLVIFDYFDSNPMAIWFGVGKLSVQWNEGFRSMFGHFYPSDTGVLGGLFLYGFFGLIFIYFIPIFFSLDIARKIKRINPDDVFIQSLNYLLIFMIISSVKGSYIHKPILYLLPLFILYAYLKVYHFGENNSNGTDKN